MRELVPPMKINSFKNHVLRPSQWAGFLLALTVSGSLSAREYHVATWGAANGKGSIEKPFLTIQQGADVAQPGDTITVHEGTYRERINPPRGGESDSKRITYQAAPGEKVEIKGSERITGWEKVQGDVWQVTLPNSFFGSFNPYSDLLHGDWFIANKRDHHTGAVYLNGDWLTEAATLDDVLKPTGKDPLWFGKVDATQTTIHAQFPGINPNEQIAEINVRRTVFYPEKTGINFLTVRGFSLRQAATPWAPPTAEQVGLIGTHWSKGWIIENNTISHSICAGITLGKHGDEFDNTSANSAGGYVKTIERAYKRGWNREMIGHHLVRGNEISHCEQGGIVGSLGGAFSTITDNVIHEIHVRWLFSGAEMAGIKLHGAIDVEISRNHIYHTDRGLWLDWMAQGTRVSRNLFHDNYQEDLFLEVNHGPFLVDNNLFMSYLALMDQSEGGAYVHNLFAGKICSRTEPKRETPYHPAHDTSTSGLALVKGGDNRFYNNIFIGNPIPPQATDLALKNANSKPGEIRFEGLGLWVYDLVGFPMHTGGNVYFNEAQPYSGEENPTVRAGFKPQLRLIQEGENVSLQISLDETPGKTRTTLVTTQRLGKAIIPQVAYENPDGTQIKIDADYWGKQRNLEGPTAGPFENPGTGSQMMKVWPAR